MEYTSESSLPHVRGCIQKFPDWVDNEIYTYNNKHMLRSNTKGYDGKTHWTGSQNSNTTAPSDREQYHLQFLLQVASLETFGYTLICYSVLSVTQVKLFSEDVYIFFYSFFKQTIQENRKFV
jgi:hypothetical protein